MPTVSISVDDNSGEVLRALQRQGEAVLRTCGERARRYAGQNVRTAGLHQTGELEGSFRTAQDKLAVYIGTDNEHAPFHELGTGHFNTKHTGASYGVPAHHFLKRAVMEHKSEYIKLIKEALSR